MALFRVIPLNQHGVRLALAQLWITGTEAHAVERGCKAWPWARTLLVRDETDPGKRGDAEPYKRVEVNP